MLENKLRLQLCAQHTVSVSYMEWWLNKWKHNFLYKQNKAEMQF